MTSRRPSTRVRELIRQSAQLIVNARPEWLEELDSAVLGANPTIAADPELAAAFSRSNQANLFFWATANVRDPGAPVPPNTGPEPMIVVRELVRRGLDTFSLDAYRVGEGVAWATADGDRVRTDFRSGRIARIPRRVLAIDQ